MATDYEIVECGPERREEALALLTRLWTTDQDVNRACWIWKYDQNPVVEGQRVYVALAGGEVVGMRGFNGARWEVDGSDATLWAPCAGDTVVVPRYEGRGVFRAIMSCAEAGLRAEGHRFMFNLSAGPAVLLRSLRSGWRPVGAYDTWVRPCSEQATMGAGEDPFADDVAAKAYASGGAGDVVLGDRPRAEEMAALVRRAPRSGRIRRVRDAAYFAWRFGNPLARYRFLYLGDALLEGYAVVRTGRYRWTDHVRIIDVEAHTPAILARLLDATVRWFGARTLEIWTASLGAATRARLRELGFAPRPTTDPSPKRRRALLVRATDSQLPADQWTLGPLCLLDPANWDLRMMWSDGA